MKFLHLKGVKVHEITTERSDLCVGMVCRTRDSCSAWLKANKDSVFTILREATSRDLCNTLSIGRYGVYRITTRVAHVIPPRCRLHQLTPS
jgi:hypothetical protein